MLGCVICDAVFTCTLFEPSNNPMHTVCNIMCNLIQLPTRYVINPVVSYPHVVYPWARTRVWYVPSYITHTSLIWARLHRDKLSKCFYNRETQANLCIRWNRTFPKTKAPMCVKFYHRKQQQQQQQKSSVALVVRLNYDTRVFQRITEHSN